MYIFHNLSVHDSMDVYLADKIISESVLPQNKRDYASIQDTDYVGWF
jgi:hypothetical protein